MKITQKTNLTRPILSLFALALILVVGTASAGDTWSVDDAHTKVGFSVNHFFTPVTGQFSEFEVNLDFNPENLEESRVSAKIPVAAINTDNEKRDAHLRSADWFEADKYPYITFKSSSVKIVGENQMIASGTLNIKGQEKVVNLPITLLGTRQIPEKMQAMLMGSLEVTSFKATLQIERGDFGVGTGSWAGDMVVGSTVDIDLFLEAHRK